MSFFIFLFWSISILKRPSVCNADTKILALGNSRTQFGVNNHIVSDCTNLGLNASNYIILYQKLKLIHKYTPSLTTILLQCDGSLTHHYFENADLNFHPYYWDLMEANDWLFLLKNDHQALSFPLHWLKMVNPIKAIISECSIEEVGMGGYSDLRRNKLEEGIEREGRTDSDSKEARTDQRQIKYLEKIIGYCNENQLEIILFAPPSYPTEKVKQSNQRVVSFISTNYPNLKFLNYELMQLPDSCYGDIAHLNLQGAKLFSIELEKELCGVP